MARSSTFFRFALTGLLITAAPALAGAQEILKNEPRQGGLRTGEVVYVDNGKCPKGQVLKVTGGSFGARNQAAAGQGRTRQCVPRP